MDKEQRSNSGPRLRRLQHAELWTAGQRGVVAGLVGLLLLLAAGRWWGRPTHLADPMPDVGPLRHELRDRIDPNHASVEQLVALPGMGMSRARAIVDYREAFTSSDPTRPAFKSSDDLMDVKGFGQATVENLRPYLIFPGDKLP